MIGVSESYEFFYPAKTLSGIRALEHIPFELDILSVTKPLVLTTERVEHQGLVSLLIDAFKGSERRLGIFTITSNQIDITLIRELYFVYRDGGYDALVVLGSGALVDVAKVLNIAVSGKPEDIERYAGQNIIEKYLNPLILIPTLSGTGYESTGHAFIGTLRYSSPYLIPHCVVMDPRTMIVDDLVAVGSTSLIALTQAVESFMSPAKNPLRDSYSFMAVRYIMENLRTVMKNPHEKGCCLALANAHHAAGCAFFNGSLGIVHTLGVMLADTLNLPPGVCMGIVLPYMLDLFRLEFPTRVPDLLLPLGGYEMYAETEEPQRGLKAVSILFDFQRDLFHVSNGAIPLSLKDMGVPRELVRDFGKRVSDIVSGISHSDRYALALEQAWEGNGRGQT